MAQRSVEILIGRLMTDETFRSAFLSTPDVTLTRFVESGYDLTAVEIAAVKATDAGVWTVAAEQIDPRLEKASLDEVSGHRSRGSR